jgi:hypothetical protein
MSKRYNGPKLSDVDVKRIAGTYADRNLYLNKGRFEYIDILNLLEFKLSLFAPGFAMEIVEDDYPNFNLPDANAQRSLAYTDPSVKKIFVSLSLYQNAYSGDAWSRYLLAHELGHAILHSDYTDRTSHFSRSYVPTVTSVDESRVRGIPLFRDSERQADLFADFFLMPDYFLNEEMSDSHLADFAKVEISSAKARLAFYFDELAGRTPTYSSGHRHIRYR